MASAYQILANTFGLAAVKPRLYSAGFGEPLATNAGDYPDTEVQVVTRLNTGGLDQEVTSYLGTPVFADLTLKADENDAGLNIQTVLFEVDQQRNIVTTTVQGRNGTVKEYISDGDYAVSLRGLLVDPDPYTYPAQQMQGLMDRLRLPQSLVAVSGFLQLFQIYNLVITGYRFFQIEGFQNVQAFELQCISDTPVELIEEDA
jgi:hypothetical protein